MRVGKIYNKIALTDLSQQEFDVICRSLYVLSCQVQTSELAMQYQNESARMAYDLYRTTESARWYGIAKSQP